MLFMNPRAEKMMWVKAIAGFVLRGRSPVVEGEEVEVPAHLGFELIHSNKAQRITAETPKPVAQDLPKDPPKDSNDSPRKSKP